MAETTWEEKAAAVLGDAMLRAAHPGVSSDDAINAAMASALRAQYVAGLEKAAEWVRLGRWHDPDSCAEGIRKLGEP